MFETRSTCFLISFTFWLKISIKPKTLPQFSRFYYLCAEYSEMTDAECPQVGDPEFFLSTLVAIKGCVYTAEPRKTKGQGTGKNWSLQRGFVISTFFSIYFTIIGVKKIVLLRTSLYRSRFVFIKFISSFHCIFRLHKKNKKIIC